MKFHRQLENKITGKTGALSRIKSRKKKGATVVFTNGVFDILHPGHVDYLMRASTLGDFLIVGLNSDKSVKTLGKGKDRPLNDQKSRAIVLSGLGCVDAVVIFDEPTPEKLIGYLMPDVLVKGDDYRIDEIAGSETVKKNGGKVITVPLVKGYSTSAMLKRIRS
jgi:rfaE bifunctional protein nucleotidyltransferase chain/domain